MNFQYLQSCLFCMEILLTEDPDTLLRISLASLALTVLHFERPSFLCCLSCSSLGFLAGFQKGGLVQRMPLQSLPEQL